MPPIKKKQEYRLAINLFDTDELAIDIRKQILGGKLDLKKTIPVDLDRTKTSVAVVFTCDLLTAALAVDVIRSENRRLKETPIRAYLNRGGDSWSRIPETSILTVVNLSGEGFKLNPKVFAEKEPEEELLPFAPLAPEKAYWSY